MGTIVSCNKKNAVKDGKEENVKDIDDEKENYNNNLIDTSDNQGL